MKGMLSLFGNQENVNSHCNEVLFYTGWANFKSKNSQILVT